KQAERRPQHGRPHTRTEDYRGCRDECRRQKPVLKWQREHRRTAREVEDSGVERGYERRILRVRETGETAAEMRLQTVKEVDRLRVREPECPCIPSRRARRQRSVQPETREVADDASSGSD